MSGGGELNIVQGSEDWKRLRKLCTTTIPGKQSALYFLNSKIRGLETVVPMTYRAHLAMCLFAESATGIPAIDEARIKLILVPRGVGKSSMLTKGLPILRTLRNPEYATGLANETAALAQTFLQDIKHEFESNTLLKTLFPEVIPDDFRSTTWKADRIITNRKKSNPTSPTILATGVGGTVTGVHMNEWICDDLLSQNAAEAAFRGNAGEIEATNRWITRLQPLLKSPKRDPMIFIGCIEETQPVLMADGTWKPIKDVEVGDMVWATRKDGSEGFRARRVTGVWPQGEADVVEIDIAGRQVRCTHDHPFLADASKNKWTTPGEMEGRIEAFMTKRDEITELPHSSAWLLGFMMGDGWVTKTTRTYKNADGNERSNGTTYAVCFSKGVDESLNLRAQEAIEALSLGCRMYDTAGGYMRLDSVEVGKYLEELGIAPGVGAKEKRIPRWIFQDSIATKRLFLRGLGDADGSWTSPTRYALELSNEGLIRDVHLLAMSCGCKPTKITKRTRMIQPPNSPKPVEMTSWHVGVNFYDSTEETHRFKVKSVTPAGRANVFDLTVEDGECAFVTNGLISSNTRWWEGDSYEFVEEFFGRGEPKQEFVWTLKLPAQKLAWEEGVVDRPPETQQIKLYVRGDVAVFKFPALDENGRPIFPERYDVEELQQMQEEDPVFFAGQYLLEPTAGAASVLDPAWLKTYEIDGSSILFDDPETNRKAYLPIRELTTFISVDPAFSKKSSNARTAIPVVGTDGTRLFLLEDFADRLDSEDDIAAKVLDFFLRYRPQKIFVETIVAQVAVANAIRRRFREEGLPEPPLEEIRSHGTQKKVMRIYGMEHYFKRGIFYYHKTQFKFFNEYVSFPRAILRDVLDAISFQKDEWERIFSMTHKAGPRRSPEDAAKSSELVKQKIRAAWGRRRRT